MIPFVEFDENSYDAFIAKSDYNGAADYLSQFISDNLENQTEINNEVSRLRNKANQLQWVLDSADQKTKDAVIYIDAYNNGATLSNLKGNSYVDTFNERYAKIMESFKNDEIIFDDKQHKNYFLGIDLLSPDDDPYEDSGWDLFLNNLGIDKNSETLNDDLAKYGITYRFDEGGRTLMKFNGTNLTNNMAVIKALDLTDTNHNVRNGVDALDENIKGVKRWESAKRHEASRELERKDTTPYYFNDYDRANPNAPTLTNMLSSTQYSLSELGKKIGDVILGLGDAVESPNITLDEDISEVIALNEEAQETYNTFMNRDSKELTGSFQIYSGLPTVNHMELNKNFAMGGMKSEYYGKVKTMLDNQVKAALTNATNEYLHSEVYAVNKEQAEGDEDKYVLNKLDKESDRQNVIAQITANIDNIDVDRDISYAIGPNGDGILVTIEPSNDTGNDNKALKDFYSVGRRQFFIKGLIDSPLTRKFRQSDDYKAIQDLNSVMYDGRPIVTSNRNGLTTSISPSIVYDNQGNRTVDTNNLVLTTKTVKGEVSSTPISKADAIRELQKKHTIDSTVNEAFRSLYDPNGNYRGNINLEKQLDRVINAAIEQFYPEEVSMLNNGEKLGYDVSSQRTFVQQMYQEMLDEIMQRLNIKIDKDKNK